MAPPLWIGNQQLGPEVDGELPDSNIPESHPARFNRPTHSGIRPHLEEIGPEGNTRGN